MSILKIKMVSIKKNNLDRESSTQPRLYKNLSAIIQSTIPVRHCRRDGDGNRHCCRRCHDGR